MDCVADVYGDENEMLWNYINVVMFKGGVPHVVLQWWGTTGFGHDKYDVQPQYLLSE